MKNLLLLFFLSFAILVPQTVEASDFDYSIIQPGEGDLCLNQAQDIASLYFNQNNKMGYCLDSNNDRYSSVSHFICMNYTECSTNAWVISFIDKTAEVKPESCFIGMVVVHSPTGKVLYFTDQNYWNVLSTWMGRFATEGKTYAEMRAHFDLFTLPEYVMDRACFPNSYYLSEQEAFRIAYEEIALLSGLQYLDIVEFCNVHSTAELVTFPLVTNHPVWIVRVKGHLLPDESRIATYVIAISAIDRTMWFVFDAQNAIYSKINDSLCVDGIAINALPQLGAPFHWQTILPQLNEN